MLDCMREIRDSSLAYHFSAEGQASGVAKIWKEAKEFTDSVLVYTPTVLYENTSFSKVDHYSVLKFAQEIDAVIKIASILHPDNNSK
jgi:hypothetical protein